MFKNLTNLASAMKNMTQIGSQLKSLNDKLRASGSVVERWVGEKLGDAEVVRRAFQLGLAREPSSTEAERFAKLLAPYGDDRRAAFEDLCWAVFTSGEFLFNH